MARVGDAMECSKSHHEVAIIKPFEVHDEVTGDDISVSVSPFYSKLTVNKREYYFRREDGEFDGTSTISEAGGPVLIYSASE
jgi:hypothetical protein